ncbi:hypothetical protein PT286_04340 [Neisseriaceae bacterium ESL0693]|nr:hypothetical protein [Neisseriaceae bacterium ESL0693]
MKSKLICTFILTALLTACGAPKSPQPYGSEFPINTQIQQDTAQ